MPLSRRSRIALVVAPAVVLALLVAVLWWRPAAAVVVRNESGGVLEGVRIVTTARTYDLGDLAPGARVETSLPRDGSTDVTVRRGASDAAGHTYARWTIPGGLIPQIVEVRVLEEDGIEVISGSAFDRFESRR